MSIFLLFDPETTLISRFLTATFYITALFLATRRRAVTIHITRRRTVTSSSRLTWRRAGTKRRLWRRWTRLRGLRRLFPSPQPDQNNIVPDLADIPKRDHKFFSRPRKPQTQPGPGTMIAKILPVHGSTSRSPTNPSRLQSQTLITSRLFNSLIRIASSPGSKHFMYPINHRPVIRAGCRQPVILSIYSLCSISCP